MSKKTKTEPADRQEGKPAPAREPGPEAGDPSRADAARADTAAVDQVLEADEAHGGTPAPGQTETEGPAEPSWEDLRRQCDEAADRALRFQAELENYRKRVARQMEDQRRYANMPLLRDLLPVWDNMGRAIEAAEKNHEITSLLEGFKMVARQLEEVIGRHHCTRIEALGRPFDPHRHEAISQQPSDDHPPNTVVQVVQAGFQLHDRVVRPSQVIVSTPAAPAASKPEPATPAEDPPLDAASEP